MIEAKKKEYAQFISAGINKKSKHEVKVAIVSYIYLKDFME